MTGRIRHKSERSNASSSVGIVTGNAEMEYFWCIELNAEKRCVKWVVKRNETGAGDDEDDGDFMDHVVFVKLAVLGANAVAGEQNVIMLESEGQDGQIQKGAIVNLTRGLKSMATLNFTVHGKIGGTFTLTEGSGPVTISGNHLLEFPKDDNLDDTQAESGNDQEESDEVEEDDLGDKKGKDKRSVKRKAVPKVNKQKKVKIDDDMDDDEEEDDDDDDDDDDDYEEEIKTKQVKKVKDTDKKAKPKAKTDKESGKKITKKMKK